jgi:hypothetical protein
MTTVIFEYLGYALVAFEAVSLLYALVMIPRIIRTYRVHNGVRRDFLLNLRQSIAEVLFKGRVNAIVSVLSSEFAMLRYALFFFRGDEERFPHQHSFTTYKASGYSLIFFVLLSVAGVEIIGMHILVSIFWNSTAALVLTILGVYTLLFLMADYSAMIKRPIVLENEMLLLRIGTRWVAEIPYHNIISVEAAPKRINTEMAAHLTKLTSFGNGTVILELKQPTSLLGHYGIRKSAQKLLCSVDNPHNFISILHEKMLGFA